MKIFIPILLITSLSANGQFTSGNLQAAGVTCALCSKAIYESLKQIPFVQSIEPEIKNASFKLRFKNNVNVDPDVLKKAVEDAGFSIAKLKLTGTFNNVSINNDQHTTIEGKVYHFLNIKSEIIQGERTLTIVDKNFLPAKEFKKFAAATQLNCVKTGKAAACCSKSGIALNTRIYHVTI